MFVLSFYHRGRGPLEVPLGESREGKEVRGESSS